jgi:curved DNA-binding protein CbpA
MRSKRTKTKEPREQNPYEVLGISETASSAVIRRAYLEKVRLHPPEKDAEGFKIVRKAYDQLKDAAERKVLDLSLFRRESGLGPFSDLDVDFGPLFLDRVFQLFIASSDLYPKDFRKHFTDISETIGKLK